MASYPTSVFSPSAKSNGQVIQASFFNDPDGEITAVENGLLNGLQHALTVNGAVTISTGGLTVSTGNVSLGQNLNVAGNSTIAGSLTVTGVLSAPGVQLPSAKLSLSSVASSIATATWTGLNWTNELHDSTAMHSTATNSSRLNLTSSGLWLVGAQADWTIGTNPSTLSVSVRILLNDAAGLVGQTQLLSNLLSVTPTQNVTGIHYATSTTDYVTMQVWQNSAANMVLNGSTGSGLGPTHFWAQKVGLF